MHGKSLIETIQKFYEESGGHESQHFAIVQLLGLIMNELGQVRVLFIDQASVLGHRIKPRFNPSHQSMSWGRSQVQEPSRAFRLKMNHENHPNAKSAFERIGPRVDSQTPWINPQSTQRSLGRPQKWAGSVIPPPNSLF